MNKDDIEPEIELELFSIYHYPNSRFADEIGINIGVYVDEENIKREYREVIDAYKLIQDKPLFITRFNCRKGRTQNGRIKISCANSAEEVLIDYRLSSAKGAELFPKKSVEKIFPLYESYIYPYPSFVPKGTERFRADKLGLELQITKKYFF